MSAVPQRKMKGKNKPSRRHRKKQDNIIEEKKPQIKAQKRELVSWSPFLSTAAFALMFRACS